MKKYLLLLLSFYYSEASNLCDYKFEEKNNICLELTKTIDIEYIKNYLDYENSKNLISFDKKSLNQYNNLNEFSENNLNLLKKHLYKYKNVYNELEKKYSVNKEVISSILLYETKLGSYNLEYNNKDFNSLLNNKLLTNPINSNKVENLIKNTITFCYTNKISVDNCNFKTSKNGDFGIAQFSSENLKYIIPVNNNYDLNVMEVSINSLANLLVNVLKIEKINYEEFKDIEEFKTYIYNKYNKKEKYIINSLLMSYYVNKYKLI